MEPLGGCDQLGPGEHNEGLSQSDERTLRAGLFGKNEEPFGIHGLEQRNASSDESKLPVHLKKNIYGYYNIVYFYFTLEI